MLNKKEVKVAIERKTPILIDPLNCEWSNSAKTMYVKAEDWEGFIPLDEFGIAKSQQGCLDDVSIPSGIVFLLKQPFYVYGVYEQTPGRFLLSHKRYSENCKEKISIGQIYEATVAAVCNFGVFCDIEEDVRILVPVKEFSVTRFYILEKIVKPGTKFPVVIIEKKKQENGNTFIYASRVKVVTKNSPNIGDIIAVTLGNLVSKKDGFFCEVTPDISGVIDINIEDIDKFSTGDKLLGRIVKITPNGYRLDSIV